MWHGLTSDGLGAILHIGERGVNLVRWSDQPGAPLLAFLPWEADHALVGSENLAALRQRMEKFEIASRFGAGAWYEDDGTDAATAKQTVCFLRGGQLLPPGGWVKYWATTTNRIQLVIVGPCHVGK
eukprot:10452784-Alexandrium_andersonii.AAC.1